MADKITEMASGNKDTYFAAADPKEAASNLLSKAQSFFNIMRSNAYLEKLSKNWSFYHGGFLGYGGHGHQINFTGEQGELTHLPINHYRNLANHMHVMVTSNRPTMEARAINADYKSLAQTYLANGILDYYMREKGLEDALKKATEIAIVMGAGFIKLDWNATAGDIYDEDPDTGEFVREGEAEFTTLTPFDVVVDGTKESWQHDWIMVRTYQNRYNLMAKYPEMAQRIKELPSKSESAVYRLAIWSNDDTDDIPVYEFFHKKTEALQEGRYLLFLDADLVLMDTKMPYRDIPIYRIAPADILGTPYGYTPMFDIFPIQEGLNSLYSTIMTNQNAFGVQNVWMKPSADISVSQLEGSLNVIQTEEPPQALNLTETPAEVFKFVDMLVQAAETISGVNSVARGNPEASLKSGTALALVQSMALQFISGLQQSYVKLVENVGTSLINILKDFATTPKVVALVGQNNRTFLKEFTGESINSINRVVVDIGNPLAKTTAGRVQMADQLLQMQLIKNPAQYFQVLNTGRLDTMFEGEMKELLLVRQENEKFLENEDIQATALDDHRLHITEHKSVLSDPDYRKDPALVQKVLAHIQEHIDLLRNTDPDLLQILGQQPLAPVGGIPKSGELPPGPMNMPTPPTQGGAPIGNIQGFPVNPAEEAIKNASGMEMLPKMPTPPPPFENLPVTAQNKIPT